MVVDEVVCRVDAWWCSGGLSGLAVAVAVAVVGGGQERPIVPEYALVEVPVGALLLLVDGVEGGEREKGVPGGA